MSDATGDADFEALSQQAMDRLRGTLEEDPDLDVEVIALGWDFYRRLGLQQVTLIVNSLGEPDDRARYVEALRNHFEAAGDALSEQSRETLNKNPLRVLVTNDDGIGAPGIDALVQALTANSNLMVVVVAPATNQSGTGDQVTNQPGATITSTASETASGVPGIAIEGFPADAALWGIRTTLPPLPDLVVSGINTGQNIGEAVRLSGTVGSALWAARLGIPAFAASTQSQSWARCAAASAVISAWSKGGDTSTRSIPTRSRAPRPRTSSSACQLASPPGTGVPVPGAKAGSRPSMSKER